MRKKFTYIILIIVFASAVSFVVVRYNQHQQQKRESYYPIHERKGNAALLPEWASTKNQAEILLERIKADPTDDKSKLMLAALYIQESRVTGDLMYYDMAAMKYVNEVLQHDSTNFDALVYKSIIYLSQHHFADGLATAQRAQAINPYNAFVYGILVDADVESGYYDSAVANADRMVSIRPDLRSYSRISYLREIYGDYPGAIEAMKLAVDAGVPGEEATEWARVQLAQLYEKTGDRKAAAMHYTISLDERPGYAYAIAGMARLASDSKQYRQAIQYYMAADSTVSDLSFKEDLAELYKKINQPDNAAKLIEEVIASMSSASQSAVQNASIGHYADKELAYAYLREKDLDKALEHATMEYNRRPDNIDVNECMAWVYYARHDYAKALTYIKVALKTKSKNPVLLCRAGLIFYSAGMKNTAKALLSEATSQDPVMEEDLKTVAVKTLESIH
jgi:tetratricopeptide (TPR) repeat protein